MLTSTDTPRIILPYPSPSPEPDRIELTVNQAAKELQRSPRTVRRLAAKGKLVARKVIRKDNRAEWLIDAASVRTVAADYAADTAAVSNRGQVSVLADHIKSLREEQGQVAALLADRLEKVERAVRALPPASNHKDQLTQLMERMDELTAQIEELLTPAPEQPKPRGWHKRVWRWLQGGPNNGEGR